MGTRTWAAGARSRFWRTRSFALYEFHYLIMMGTAWLFTNVLALPAVPGFLAVLLLPTGISLLLYEVISRIPGLRALFALKRAA